MTKKIITLALILASLISCNTTNNLSEEELHRISWKAFCNTFGYNDKLDANNQEAINNYLDCWRGSADEEDAFSKLGINLY
jgi:hypothetical protein